MERSAKVHWFCFGSFLEATHRFAGMPAYGPASSCAKIHLNLLAGYSDPFQEGPELACRAPDGHQQANACACKVCRNDCCQLKRLPEGLSILGLFPWPSFKRIDVPRQNRSWRPFSGPCKPSGAFRKSWKAASNLRSGTTAVIWSNWPGS